MKVVNPGPLTTSFLFATVVRAMENQHGSEHNWRIHAEFDAIKGMGYEETRSDRYCSHCGQWIQVHGVTGTLGALAWIANHQNGECSISKEG